MLGHLKQNTVTPTVLGYNSSAMCKLIYPSGLAQDDLPNWAFARRKCVTVLCKQEGCAGSITTSGG